MDYDDDGILDFISGSYDPGDIYLFRGLGEGKYAAVENIYDEEGVPLAHHPKELKAYNALPEADRRSQENIGLRVASFGSWVTPVDWDSDGDLDLLIGSFAGELFLRRNEGTRSEPVYSAESVPVEAAGKPLKVNSHADPVATDWDGDGLWDLVVGVADGSVGWFRNVGSAEEPRFDSWRELIEAKSDSKFLAQYQASDEAPQPGVRAQICVIDYDRDGLKDIVLGDYSDVHPLRDLDEKERAAFDELLAAEAQLKEDGNRDGLSAIAQQKKRYTAGESRRTSHVWLYRRLPAAEASGSEPGGEQASAERPAASSSELVAIEAEVIPSETKGRLLLTVRLDIAPGWHLYATLPDSSGLRTLDARSSLPAGVEAVSEWRRPKGQVSLADPGARVYEGSIRLDRELSIDPGAEPGSVEVTLVYQACNDSGCLPPEERRLKATLPSSSGGD